MSFETILKNLLENAIHAFNTGNFKNLDNFLIEQVELSLPEVKNEKIHCAAAHIIGRENLYHFWKEIKSSCSNEITDVEFLEVGKVSHIQCTYGKVDIIMDLHIHFDVYGKVTKLQHSIPNLSKNENSPIN